MVRLPRGVVTFVFTDIEGSTRLFQQLGSEYRPVLETHRRLLREAFARHRGAEVQTEGDGFFVAFHRASEAVSACLDGQRALAAYAWPQDARLRVRMGLHTGAADPVGGDYVSLAVHQAARIAAAGHGGQVLVSETGSQAAADSLPDGAGLADLGAYRLKDFDEPQHLYQLTHADLDRDFPSLRVLPAEGHNLPLDQTSFVGRESEVSAIGALVRSTPLVTITGPGGVGKTRLALEVGRQALPDHPDGVWMVELASLADSASVPRAVASVLGVREEPGRPLQETLVDALRARAVLVVLDNCEHVIDACSRLIANLLRDAFDLRVLATSREPICAAGEHVWALSPLPVPELASPMDVLRRQDAVRLFVDRAVAARSDFELDPTSSEAVAQICRALDGLPLALELAASRVTTLSPRQILSRLERRLSLLTGGVSGAPERQRTLRGAIGWSYDMLSQREQVLLNRLAVFSGGCSLEAAEDVAGAGLDDLQSLVAKSLVQSVDERFSMLETIREFAQEQLERTGQDDVMRRRHAEYFSAAAPRLGWGARSSDPSALAQIDVEYDNCCAAFDWAAAHDAFDVCEQLVEGLWYPWVRRGLTMDGYRRALGALELCPEPSPMFVTLVGELARLTGDLERAVSLKRDAIAGFEAAGAPDSRVAATYTDLAEALIELGRLDEAQPVADRGLELRLREGDGFGVAHARAALVMLELGRGNHARAAALSDESLPAFRAARSWSDVAWECVRSATAHGRARDIESARARLREALDHAINIDEAAVMVAAIEQASVLAALLSDDDTSLRLLGAARSVRKLTGFVFRADEFALTVIGDRVDVSRLETLLREGESMSLTEATRLMSGFLG